MKYRFRHLLFFVLSMALLFGCSSDPVQEGDQAFQKGRYGPALKYYKTAYQAGTQTPELKEKMARAALNLGMKLYQQRRVIKALEARINEAENYLSGSAPSDSMNRALSEAYLMLAGAYDYERAENFIQKRKFFEAALENYRKAIALDSANTKARKAAREFQEKYFAKYFQKGLELFKAAKKDKANYFSAEYYFEKAYRMAPEHEEANDYLKRTRKAALPLLNLHQAFPFAISDKLEKPNWLAFYIFLQNNTLKKDTVSAANFYLITEAGDEIQGQSSSQFSKPFQTQPLESGAEAKGVVTFAIKAGQKPVKIVYREGNKVQSFKYLP